MLKKLILILLLIGLVSCKRKECSLPIVEIKMINKIAHSYGGKSSVIITNKEKIKVIKSLLEELKTDISNSTSPQMNYGFVEVLYSTADCKNVEYFNVVFTETHGVLVHYNSDKDYDYEYFRSNEIVQNIKREMKISKNR